MSVPVLPLVAGLVPAMAAWNREKARPAMLPGVLVYEYTGFDVNGGTGWHSNVAIRNLGMMIAATAGHLIANNPKVGLNRAIRKATMGYAVL